MQVVVRVKWAGGYVEVLGPGGGPRRTIAFDAADARTRAKAIEIGEQVLVEYADRPVRSWAAQIGDTPSWPEVGDRIETFDVDGSLTDVRLVSKRVAVSDTGFARLEPTLGTRRDLLVERNQRALKKLTDGLQGRSSASEPLLMPSDTGFAAGQMTETQTLSWAASGILVSKSPVQVLSEPTVLTRLQLTLTLNTQASSAPNPTQPDTPPDTIPDAAVLDDDVWLTGWFNQKSIGPFSLPHDRFQYDYLLANAWPADTTIQYGIIYAGASPPNTNALLAQRTLTLNLYGVTGTWAPESAKPPTPELR